LKQIDTPNHWELLNLDVDDRRGDIRDREGVFRVFEATQPEIVFHLAAQSLVRRSYLNPGETWETNVQGTVNILEAARYSASVKAMVMVTTDKCYENMEQIEGYRETDRLGGHDPYSASKAACELVISSYRDSFFSQAAKKWIASARAGNVIGGGDFSDDRLIPDVYRSIQEGKPLEIRSPDATRPWQHVLDCLSGYLLVGQHLWRGKSEMASAWNFGPGPDSNRSVRSILDLIRHHWPELAWFPTQIPQPHESKLLYLDCAKARRELEWRSVWNLEESIALTAQWYEQFLRNRVLLSSDQLDRYVSDSTKRGMDWAGTSDPVAMSE
jgi:CDP-glucose 4,6-dehydratase